MHRSSIFLLLLTLGCASTSSSRPPDFPQPDISARMVAPIFFGSGTTAPAPVEVEVRNRGRIPLVVNRIQVDSPGMTQFSIRTITRDFKQTLAPGESRAFTVFATAINETGGSHFTEPLTLRAIIEVKANDNTWREVLMMRNTSYQ